MLDDDVDVVCVCACGSKFIVIDCSNQLLYYAIFFLSTVSWFPSSMFTEEE